jgi:hypothetical protein
MTEGFQKTLPGLCHIQNQVAPPARVESTIRLELPKAVVEQHDCRAAGVEYYSAVLDSRPVVAGYGGWLAEPIGSVVVEQPLRTRMALVVGEVVDLVVVQGTHTGPGASTCQH